MDERLRQFLERNNAAAMITLREDGAPHAVRVGVALVDGKIWSSAVEGRRRTRHLRRDPRAALYMQDSQSSFGWVTIEGKVTILEGEEAPALNLRLFREMQRRPAPQPLMWFGRELGEEEFLQAMRDEKRLIYELEPLRAYGQTDANDLWSVTLK